MHLCTVLTVRPWVLCPKAHRLGSIVFLCSGDAAKCSQTTKTKLRNWVKKKENKKKGAIQPKEMPAVPSLNLASSLLTVLSRRVASAFHLLRCWHSFWPLAEITHSRHLYCIVITQGGRPSSLPGGTECTAFTVSLACLTLSGWRISPSKFQKSLFELKTLTFPCRGMSLKPLEPVLENQTTTCCSGTRSWSTLTPSLLFFPLFFFFFTWAACRFVRPLIRHRKSSLPKYAGMAPVFSLSPTDCQEIVAF